MLVLVLVAALAAAAVGLLVLAHRLWTQNRYAGQYLESLADRVSDRLTFRRPELSDFDFYLEMAADPLAAEANGWSGAEQGMVRSRFNSRPLFNQLRDSELVAVERISGTPVATATFSTSPLARGARSAGIHVHPEHRGRGYGREIMAAAILLLQTSPGAIHVGTRVTNIGIQRIMEQLGFDAEPGTHPYSAPNGESYDAYWYHCGAETHPPADVRPT